jgi:hypothetical protein
MAGRIYMVVDLGPDNGVKSKFIGHADWVNTIKEKTGNIPVVFYNSYQRTSLFWFYSGLPSHCIIQQGSRKNNFNYWPTADPLTGKPVFIADIYGISTFPDSVNTKKGWVGLRYTPVFTGK